MLPDLQLALTRDHIGDNLHCTIQALPGQFSLMCSGASFALSMQTLSRPVALLVIRWHKRDVPLAFERYAEFMLTPFAIPVVISPIEANKSDPLSH
jgi:hypothetical protein